MATYISAQTGLWTDASGTWALADSTAELDSEAGTTAISTTNLDSATFTPGAITVGGVAVKISARAASPTGTFTVTLRNSTDAVNVDSVTVNVSDIDAGARGWFFVKFASSATLIAGKAYLIRVVCSNTGSQVTLYRNATANNWSRQLRTTTTATLGSGDKVIVAGEHTGAGTGNSFTITMDNTTTTSFGLTTFPQSVTINKRATLTYGTTASTDYYLKVAGIVTVMSGGTFNIGTTGTPIPSTSTAVLEFNVTANVDSGLRVETGGTFIAQGNAVSVTRAYLNADASAAATSLTTDVTTGWKNGDKIAIASTTRTNTETETTTLTVDASGTTLTVSAITNAHSGSGATKAEIINLTRNVKIRGTSTTLQGFIYFSTTGIADIDYVEFSKLGSNTSEKHGIEYDTTTGSVNIQFCAMYDFGVSGSSSSYITGNTHNNITISNNNMWNIQSGFIFQVQGTSGTNLTIDGNWCLRNLSGTGVSINDAGMVVTNNVTAGCSGVGLSIDETAPITGTYSGNISHSNGGRGFNVNSVIGGLLSNFTAWRNSSNGLSFASIQNKIIFDGFVAFGNTTSNVVLASTSYPSLIELSLRNFTLNAGSTLTCPVGLEIPQTIADRVTLDGSSLGATTSHSTGDINISNANARIKLVIRNTVLASTTEIANLTNLLGGSTVGIEKADQTAGSHRSHIAYANGIIGRYDIDTTIFDSTPSLKITPASTTRKFESPRFKSAVANGQSLNVSVKVRESVSGDGADYSGARIRLIVAANPALGINQDTVLATATVSSEGAFETIAGNTATVNDNGVLEFFVDCDGTTGFINIDTFSVT